MSHQVSHPLDRQTDRQGNHLVSLQGNLPDNLLHIRPVSLQGNHPVSLQDSRQGDHPISLQDSQQGNQLDNLPDSLLDNLPVNQLDNLPVSLQGSQQVDPQYPLGSQHHTPAHTPRNLLGNRPVNQLVNLRDNRQDSLHGYHRVSLQDSRADNQPRSRRTNQPVTPHPPPIPPRQPS